MRHKVFFFQLLFLTLQIQAFSQKHDNVWIFGYNSNTIDSSFGGSTIDFNLDPPDAFYEYRYMDMDITNASICDSSGNLLFYTNGISISNYLHEMIPNSDTLNPGGLSDEFYEYGYPLPQGVMILSLPGSDSLFYVFHKRWQKPMNGIPNSHVDALFYTIVNMNMNNGTGGIVEKRIELIIDTLSTGELTAVKHSNGIDWWLLVREFRKQRYHKLLFTNDGITYMGTQAIGVAPYSVEVLGQAVFSPDGTKYVRYGAFSYILGSYLEYFDFDRCTGELSNPGFISHLDSAGSAGAAISPNSRFLYCSSGRFIYQFDFQAEDFAASKDTVAVYDGFLSPFPTRFFSGSTSTKWQDLYQFAKWKQRASRHS